MNMAKMSEEIIALKQEMERLKAVIGRQDFKEELGAWEKASIEDSKSFEIDLMSSILRIGSTAILEPFAG